MRSDDSEACEHDHHDDDGALVLGAEETQIELENEQRGLAARFGIWMIRGYQRFISPLTPPACRYTPTCSQYTLIAIRKYGLIRGSWMGMKRISRCHPLKPGGYDPVP